MPRNGDGSSDNGPIEAGHNVAHGVPQSVSFHPSLLPHLITPQTAQRYSQIPDTFQQGEKIGDHVARADKTAPLPGDEKGQGLSDANASGGQSQGIKQGDNVGQGK